MKRIALTGSIACGKTTFVNILRRLGLPVVDADAIVRELQEPGTPGARAIAEEFGREYFDGNGRLLRKKLAQTIFSDEEARARLNALIHPLVKEEMERRAQELARSGAPAVVFDVPLLFETRMEGIADEVWAVYAPREVQISRLMTRDGITRDQALLRIASQMDALEKAKRADRAINTDVSLDELCLQAEKLCACILGRN